MPLVKAYAIFWYTIMNLLAKTAEFEKLCYQLSKRSQQTTEEDAKPYSKPPGQGAAPGEIGPPAPPAVSKAPIAKSSPLQPGAHPGLPANPSAPAKVAPKPAAAVAKPTTPTKRPAPWLDRYMGKDKLQEDTDAFVAKHKEGDSARQALLDAGPSVSNKTKNPFGQ